MNPNGKPPANDSNAPALADARPPSETLARIREHTESSIGRVRTLACSTIDKDTSRAPLRVLDCYALSYVLQGAGAYVDAEGRELPVRSGDLIVVCPGVAHRYGPGPGQPWHEIWAMFEGPVFDLWREANILSPEKPIRHLEPIEHWRNRIETVRGMPQSPSSAPLLEVARLQKVLAEMMVSEAVADLSIPDFDWSLRACALLESEPLAELPEVARRLGMSYSAFRRQFTRVAGMSPARYRNQRRIEEACRLLRETGMTNQEMADRLGFADEFHFSHRFKDLTGHSPSGFREALARSASGEVM